MPERINRKRISRRDFLKFTGMAAGTGVLAACGQKPETPTHPVTPEEKNFCKDNPLARCALNDGNFEVESEGIFRPDTACTLVGGNRETCEETFKNSTGENGKIVFPLNQNGEIRIGERGFRPEELGNILELSTTGGKKEEPGGLGSNKKESGLDEVKKGIWCSVPIMVAAIIMFVRHHLRNIKKLEKDMFLFRQKVMLLGKCPLCLQKKGRVKAYILLDYHH